MFKKISKKIIPLAILVAVFLLAGIFVSTPRNVHAVACDASAGNVHGWLWSETIGWISLNCNDAASPTGYGVTQDISGNWTGYGWSENIGWVNFGAGCPGGGSFTSNCNTKLVGNNLVGWAKFPAAINDGWDGWLSMSSLNETAPPTAYGATKSGNTLTGYAWGSDVVGWTYFNNVTVPVPGTPDLTLTANPVYAPQSTHRVTLTYNSTQPLLFTSANCTGTSSSATQIPGWTTSAALGSLNPSGTQSVSGVLTPDDPTMFTVTCPLVAGGTIAASVTVPWEQLGGAVTLTETANNICVQGSTNSQQTTTFSWNDTLVSDTSCKLYKDDNGTFSNANMVASGYPSGTFTDGPFTSTTGSPHSYIVKCFASGSTSAIDQVYVYDTNTTTPINCTNPSWGITLSGGPNTICPTSGTSAAFTWQSWGSVPSGYVSAILYTNITDPTTNNYTAQSSTPFSGLSGTATGISTPGYYWIRFVDGSGGLSSPSDVVHITKDCVHTFNGPSGLSPLCPAGSQNQAHSVPKAFSWTSNSNNGSSACIANGELPSGPSGLLHVTSVGSSQGTRSVTCTWGDGYSQSNSAYYGPMLLASDPICTTPATANNPKVIEQ